MTEREYLEKRVAEELAATMASGDLRAAHAHRALAVAYQWRLSQMSPLRRRA